MFLKRSKDWSPQYGYKASLHEVYQEVNQHRFSKTYRCGASSSSEPLYLPRTTWFMLSLILVVYKTRTSYKRRGLELRTAQVAGKHPCDILAGGGESGRDPPPLHSVNVTKHHGDFEHCGQTPHKMPTTSQLRTCTCEIRCNNFFTKRTPTSCKERGPGSRRQAS